MTEYIDIALSDLVLSFSLFFYLSLSLSLSLYMGGSHDLSKSKHHVYRSSTYFAFFAEFSVFGSRINVHGHYYTVQQQVDLAYEVCFIASRPAAVSKHLLLYSPLYRAVDIFWSSEQVRYGAALRGTCRSRCPPKPCRLEPHAAAFILY